MLTYIPPSERPVLSSAPKEEAPWHLLLLCAVWLLPGLVGHDPWKPTENQTVAVVQHMLSSGDWLLPQLAGQPWLDQAPLYYWVAAVFGKLLGGLGLALHDAVRLSTGLWAALAMWGVGMTGRELYGVRQGRVAVVALIGSIGLLTWGHHASPAMLGFAAFAWQLYALALLRGRPLRAGAVLGAAWLVLLLGATWSELALAGACALLLPVLPAWRKSPFLVVLLAAFVIAVPLGLVWPLLLHQQAPAAFAFWWDTQSLGLYGGMGDLRLFHQPGYLPSIVVWFAFPVLPLAAWALWLNRRSLRQSQWFLPLSQSLAVVFWLMLAGDPGEVQALLLLAPLAVLAGAGIDDLRRGAASSLYWFGATTLGAFAIALWAGWFVLQLGWPTRLAVELARLNPVYQPGIGIGVVFSLFVSAAWVWVLLASRSLGRRAVTGWACGLTLIWGLLVGLYQPWLNATKTYRPVGEGVGLAAQPYPGCIAAPMLGAASLGGVAYFSGRELRGAAAENLTECPLLLIQSRVTPLVEYSLLWSGHRAGEGDERFYLYRRR